MDIQKTPSHSTYISWSKDELTLRITDSVEIINAKIALRYKEYRSSTIFKFNEVGQLLDYDFHHYEGQGTSVSIRETFWYDKKKRLIYADGYPSGNLKKDPEYYIYYRYSKAK